METKILKPIDGVKIRDPKTREYLPQEGRLVEMTSYWNRRIQDGTVTVSLATMSPMMVSEFQTVIKTEKILTDKSLKKGSDL